jgi:signal transduction histidine kinase
MRERRVKQYAWIVFGLAVAAYLGALVLVLLNQGTGAARFDQRDSSSPGSALFYLVILLFAVIGVLIASRQPHNAIAWIFLAIGLSWELWWFGVTYLHYGVITRPGSVPGPGLAAALTQWLWAPAVGLMGTFLVLLFPDGRLPSRRWRLVAWLSGLAIILPSIADMLTSDSFTNLGFPGVENPLGIEALQPILIPLGYSVALLPICMVACAVGLVQRFRRSRGVERLQLKWLAAGAAVVAAGYILFWVIGIGYTSDPTPPLWSRVVQDGVAVSFGLIPIAAGIAILKHRLFDIDIVINKALVYGALVAFITAIYVGIVVGIGALIGSGDEPNLGLSLAATAIVALAFQPVRSRVQSLANRLVYGQRLSPYQAVTEFSSRIATSLSFEQVLPRMAEAAAKGVGGTRAGVKMFLPGGGTQAAFWPDHTQTNSSDSFGPADRFDRTLEVIHQGEQVGEISVAKAPGEQLDPGEDKLLKNLASQAGLAMRNLRLTAELQQKLIELQESRKRIVEAQDAERRRMERDIHDGAQQQLVSLAVKLSLAKNLALKDPAKAGEMLDQVKAETNQVVESVRDLARGIFPPLLAERGLGEALSSHAQKTHSQITIEDQTNRARFSPEIESAVYFTVREALQNASKHAPDAPITVGLSTDGDHLRFQVADQGPGFDTERAKGGLGLGNMSDRIEAIGGEFEISSQPGRGTTVEGRVPVMREELARVAVSS